MRISDWSSDVCASDLARTVETRVIRVEAATDNPERLTLLLPDRDAPVAPTHWSFGQLCSLVGAPSGYLRQLPAALAGINMQHGLLAHRRVGENPGDWRRPHRSEEHTSELQSLMRISYAVFCLKKKKN